ncbi:MAG: glycoside hydrolase family 2 TIM barrel-domain containing protein [Ferruginibacter sp.]
MIRCTRIFILQGFLFLLVNGFNVSGQSLKGRTQYSINDGWKFLPKGIAYAETVQAKDVDWQVVSLPHTWNATDPFDGDRTYRRGISWYRKYLNIEQRYKDNKIYLYFEGANQVTHVYVNGYFAGVHKGGYTGFVIDITNYLNWKINSKNIIAIQVNNAHDPFIPPLNVGYASYGGIYRDAWLVITNKLHFATIDNNSAGVYISTPSVSKQKAKVLIKTTVKNESNKEKNFQFINKITDARGTEITRLSKNITVASNQEINVMVESDVIKSPNLWSPENPYLYKVTSQLISEGNITDEVYNTMGFRWFDFNGIDGFHINSQKLQLRGTNRHQDMMGKGDALTLEDHRRDMQLIKDMGCNFVRLAHYPQAAEVLKLADELGLIVWEETPVVNFITQSPEFLNNTQNMIKEMITQGYNHPSVVMWGSTNEILLHGPDGERIGRQNDTAYLNVVKKYAYSFDSTIRAEDPSRYSTLAMHISADYSKNGLDTISQVAGYNIYSGWYSGKVEDFGNDLDRRKRAGHNVFVSEYGAEGETRLNTEKPVRFDYTGQYQRYYHESYLRQISLRPWLSGTAIWNQFDFSQPNIGGPAPHMNQKGMATWDRKNKDVYYLYQANWNPYPMVYIATRDWQVRGGEKNSPSTIDVYSNANEITLFVNGQSQKRKKGNDVRKFSWQVQLKNGSNMITATGKIKGKLYSDNITIDYHAFNSDLSDIKSLSVNVGSNAQYTDAAGNVWIEDRPYQKGSFGFISGKSKVFDRKDVIMNTADEPLLYSYQDSIQAYRFDVPDGKYRLSLCFAEPARINIGERVFDISINNQILLKDMDLTAMHGFANGVTKTFFADAKDGNGLAIKFDAIKGNPVLNGVRIEKY